MKVDIDNKKSRFEDFEETAKLAGSDPVARTAAIENDIRRILAESFRNAMRKCGMSPRELANTTNSSISQIQRLLHYELGGRLMMSTIVRAADLLGLKISIKTED